MTEEKIARINELYHKSKAEGLTEAEKAEQKELRKEFISSVRGNVVSQLNNISILEPDGTVVDLDKSKGSWNKKKLH